MFWWGESYISEPTARLEAILIVRWVLRSKPQSSVGADTHFFVSVSVYVYVCVYISVFVSYKILCELINNYYKYLNRYFDFIYVFLTHMIYYFELYKLHGRWKLFTKQTHWNHFSENSSWNWCLPTVILIIEPSQRLQYLNKNPNIVIIFGLWFHVFPVLDIMLLLISFLLRKKCKPKHMWTVRSFIFTNVDINIFLQKEKQILFFFFSLHQISISV